MESPAQPEKVSPSTVESSPVQSQIESVKNETSTFSASPSSELPERPTSSPESVSETLVSLPENPPSQLQEEDPKEIILDAVSDLKKTGYQEQDLVSLAQTLQRQHDRE